MKYCAYIGSQLVASDEPYIVYGPATGLVAGAHSFEEAHALCELNQASLRERGRDPDALVFGWNHDHWQMCGSLYDVDRLPRRVPAF